MVTEEASTGDSDSSATDIVTDMREVWSVEKTGALSGLQLKSEDGIPPPGPGEIRISVKAVSIPVPQVQHHKV